MPQSAVDRSRPRRGRGLFVFLILLLSAAAAWWYATGRSGTAPDTRPPAAGRPFSGMAGMATPVRVAPAHIRSMQYRLEAIATAVAQNTVVVRSRVDGELLALSFREGQPVEKGALLARIDPRSFQVQLDQALSQQAQNQAQLLNAERDLERYQRLYRQQSLARQQLDTQLALVEQLRAAALGHQAAVDQAQLQLGYTEIHAPIAGRLGLRRVDPGNLVSAASAEGLVTITQERPMAVTFSLPQAALADVQAAWRRDQPLEVRVYDHEGSRLLDTGTLMAIDNEIDVATGSFLLKAEMPNAQGQLFPNQFVNAHLRLDTSDGLAIPTAAIQYGSAGPFVYVLGEQSTVQVRPIVPGRVDGGYTAVMAGLEEGEAVVTQGVDRLREGARVDVITEAPAAASDSPRKARARP